MEDKLNDAIWGQLELWDLAFIVKVGKKVEDLEKETPSSLLYRFFSC